MNDRSTSPVPRRATGHGADTSISKEAPSASQQHAPNGAGLKDLRPLRGHHAVGLRPILDPNTYLGATQNRRTRPKHEQPTS
jgi:hypothetical protein